MRAVVMGGTSGIGLATAEHLASAKFDVTVTGRDPVKLAGLKGRFADAERLDGTDRDAVAAFFKRLGPFEHSRSPSAPARSDSADRRDQPRRLRDGLHRQALRRRPRDPPGAGDGVDHDDLGRQRPRRAARHLTLAAVNGAIERMVSPLAAELAPVRVNAVSPGIIDTPWRAVLPDDQRQAQFAAAAGSVPAGGSAPPPTWPAPGYLVDASLVTGTILPMDGGFTVA